MKARQVSRLSLCIGLLEQENTYDFTANELRTVYIEAYGLKYQTPSVREMSDLLSHHRSHLDITHNGKQRNGQVIWNRT